MASTQKKPTKTKGEPKRKPLEHSAPKKLPYEPNMVARGVGAGVCLFLAVLILLGIFKADAVVVNFLGTGLKGLVGYGFYLTAPALIAAAVLLVIQRKKRVAARLWCLGLIPVFFGALLHMFLSPYQYPIAPASLVRLWQDGGALFSGGALGGAFSVSFVTWFSKAGAVIIFLLVLLFLIAVAFHLTPKSMAIRRRKRREQREYDDYDDYDAPMASTLPPTRPKRPAPLAGENPMGQGFHPSQGEEATHHSSEPDLPPVTRGREDSAEPSPGGQGTEKKSRLSFLGGRETVDRLREKGKSLFRDGEPTENPPKDTVRETVRREPPKLSSQKPPAVSKEDKLKQATEEVTRSIERSMERGTQSYHFPSLDLLSNPNREAVTQAAYEELEETRERLESVLTSFGIDGRMVGAVQGPSVTRYEVELEQGVRLNKVTNLADDVALALGAASVRIAPVPGKISVVGVEVPNKVVTPVSIREVLSSDNFRRHKSSAAFSVGKDIGGNYIVGDCAKLPHLLIAGTTGSGKSVCINSLIVSMLYKSRPEELRLIMVDPKMVELGGYNGIPHLLIPVVTDPKKAAGALQWAVTEMMKRYRLFAEAGVRELSSYNAWAAKQKERQPEGKGAEPLPKVVIVIDELADLMLVAAKEVEEAICRVAQMGRASGMHLVIATQRPSADVITGLMKANIPSRIAFAVASSLESRIILDATGAEKLVGKGDMLWFPLGAGKPLRVQGCFISDEEVAGVVEEVKQNSGEGYDDRVMQEIEQHVSESEKKGKSSSGGGYPAGEEPSGETDELFNAAVDVVLELGQASVSMLQRRLKLGYARAARLVDQMEEQGIVGPFEGSKPRQMLVTKEQWEARKAGDGEQPPESDLPPEAEAISFDTASDEN